MFLLGPYIFESVSVSKVLPGNSTELVLSIIERNVDEPPSAGPGGFIFA